MIEFGFAAIVRHIVFEFKKSDLQSDICDDSMSFPHLLIDLFATKNDRNYGCRLTIINNLSTNLCERRFMKKHDCDSIMFLNTRWPFFLALVEKIRVAWTKTQPNTELKSITRRNSWNVICWRHMSTRKRQWPGHLFLTCSYITKIQALAKHLRVNLLMTSREFLPTTCIKVCSSQTENLDLLTHLSKKLSSTVLIQNGFHSFSKLVELGAGAKSLILFFFWTWFENFLQQNNRYDIHRYIKNWRREYSGQV